MTTVAFDGKTLAADTRGIDSVSCRDVYSKLAQTETHAYGFAGALIDFEVLIAAHNELLALLTENNMTEWGMATVEIPQKINDVSSMIVVNKDTLDASVLFVDENNMLRRQKETIPAAIGSGAQLAMASMMLHSKSAQQAVEDAIKMDYATGGEVKVIELGGSTH